MIERVTITVEVDGEMPASGDVAAWIKAIYSVVLDPSQRHKVREYLRDRHPAASSVTEQK